MDVLVALVFVFFAALTPAAAPAPSTVDLELEQSTWQFALLLAEAEGAKPGPGPAPAPQPDGAQKPDPNCKLCNGTGKARSGDGIIPVPCPCLDRKTMASEIGGAQPPPPPLPVAKLPELTCAKINGVDYDLDPILEKGRKHSYDFPRTSDCEECDLEVHLQEHHKVAVDDLARMSTDLKRDLHNGLEQLERESRGARAAPAPASPTPAAKPVDLPVTVVKAEPQPVLRQVLVFVSPSCQHCPRLKDMQPALRTSGASVSEAADADFRFVSCDDGKPENDALAAQLDVTSLPTLIVREGNRVVSRLQGAPATKASLETVADLLAPGTAGKLKPVAAPTPKTMAPAPTQTWSQSTWTQPIYVIPRGRHGRR